MRHGRGRGTVARRPGIIALSGAVLLALVSAATAAEMSPKKPLYAMTSYREIDGHNIHVTLLTPDVLQEFIKKRPEVHGKEVFGNYALERLLKTTKCGCYTYFQVRLKAAPGKTLRIGHNGFYGVTGPSLARLTVGSRRRNPVGIQPFYRSRDREVRVSGRPSRNAPLLPVISYPPLGAEFSGVFQAIFAFKSNLKKHGFVTLYLPLTTRDIGLDQALQAAIRTVGTTLSAAQDVTMSFEYLKSILPDDDIKNDAKRAIQELAALDRELTEFVKQTMILLGRLNQNPYTASSEFLVELGKLYDPKLKLAERNPSFKKVRDWLNEFLKKLQTEITKKETVTSSITDTRSKLTEFDASAEHFLQRMTNFRNELNQDGQLDSNELARVLEEFEIMVSAFQKKLNLPYQTTRPEIKKIFNEMRILLGFSNEKLAAYRKKLSDFDKETERFLSETRIFKNKLTKAYSSKSCKLSYALHGTLTKSSTLLPCKTYALTQINRIIADFRNNIRKRFAEIRETLFMQIFLGFLASVESDNSGIVLKLKFKEDQIEGLQEKLSQFESSIQSISLELKTVGILATRMRLGAFAQDFYAKPTTLTAADLALLSRERTSKSEAHFQFSPDGAVK